jgi:uroporphyrinogen decarboxylase
MNDRFLQALRGNNTQGPPPIWLMRQAGRHLASYRALRSRYSFLTMCHEPDLIAEITAMPIERYGMDAAVLFSDILIIAEAMGRGLRFEESIGPIIERPIRNLQDLSSLPKIDLSSVEFLAKGIKEAKIRLSVPLIGFCGAPFTVASYFIEGKSSKDLTLTKQWMYRDPASFHALLKIIADWSIAYLLMQIESGVDAIQLFDSWANSLSHHEFRSFSLAYMEYILKGLQHTNIPVILFCRGSSVFAPQMAEVQPTAIGLDWNCHLPSIRKQIPSIALQGNIDPHLLYAPLSTIEKKVKTFLQEMEGDPAFIVNLGHGVPLDVSEEAVQTLVDCVQRKHSCLTSISPF